MPGWTDVAVPRTRTGRSRLEHRHGWLDAVWQGATHIQNNPEVMCFSLSDKGIAMERVRTGQETDSHYRKKDPRLPGSLVEQAKHKSVLSKIRLPHLLQYLGLPS